MIELEKAAPDFTLRGFSKHEESSYTLSNYQGKWVVLFFYHENRTSVCHSELDALEKIYHKFTERDATVLAISKSSIDNHKGWLDEMGGLSFPLLSDPDGSVAREYDTLMAHSLGLFRGTFIIEPEGLVRYFSIGMPNVGRNIEEIYRILAATQSGETCDVGWEPKENN